MYKKIILIIMLTLFANLTRANANAIEFSANNSSGLVSTNFIQLIQASPITVSNDNTIIFVDNGPTSLGNNITLDVGSTGNVLKISQSLTIGESASNSIDISIDGSNNGGALGNSFTGPAASNGLTPGTITQIGYDNSIEMAIIGSKNVFAFLQNGASNMIRGSINGADNQVAVSQYGTGNTAVFSQFGTGNNISITQRSW